MRLEEAVQEAGLGHPAQALADSAGTLVADAVHGHEVVDGGRHEELQAAEVVHKTVRDRLRNRLQAGQQPVAAGCTTASRFTSPPAKPTIPEILPRSISSVGPRFTSSLTALSMSSAEVLGLA